MPSAITQAANAVTAPATAVTGISRPRIQTLPCIMNGRGMSGSVMRSHTIEALASPKAIRMPKL